MDLENEWAEFKMSESISNKKIKKTTKTIKKK